MDDNVWSLLSWNMERKQSSVERKKQRRIEAESNEAN